MFITNSLVSKNLLNGLRREGETQLNKLSHLIPKSSYFTSSRKIISSPPMSNFKVALIVGGILGIGFSARSFKEYVCDVHSFDQILSKPLDEETEKALTDLVNDFLKDQKYLMINFGLRKMTPSKLKEDLLFKAVNYILENKQPLNVFLLVDLKNLLDLIAPSKQKNDLLFKAVNSFLEDKQSITGQNSIIFTGLIDLLGKQEETVFVDLIDKALEYRKWVCLSVILSKIPLEAKRNELIAYSENRKTEMDAVSIYELVKEEFKSCTEISEIKKWIEALANQGRIDSANLVVDLRLEGMDKFNARGWIACVQAKQKHEYEALKTIRLMQKDLSQISDKATFDFLKENDTNDSVLSIYSLVLCDILKLRYSLNKISLIEDKNIKEKTLKIVLDMCVGRKDFFGATLVVRSMPEGESKKRAMIDLANKEKEARKNR